MNQALALDLVACDTCGGIDMPSVSICARCLGTSLAPITVEGSGRLVSWTTIRRAPARFRDEAPYRVCVVDLDAGCRVTGRLAEGGDLAVDARVAAISRRGDTPVFNLSDKVS